MNEKQNFDPKTISALIIDSHDFIRKSINRVLNRLQFEEVIEVFNPKDARIALDTKDIGVIICDLYLTGHSGFELLDLVRGRETNSDIPFLVVTGEADKDDVVKAVDKGANDYMLKPFQPEELEQKIVKILNSYHSPGPLLAKLRAAETAIQRSEFEVAKIKIQEVLAEKKDSPRALHLLGVIATKENRNEEAIKIFEHNIKLTPSYLKNYASLADVYIRNKDNQLAIRALRKELELNPKQIQRQIKVANLLLREGDFKCAMDHYRLALLEDNKNPEALYGMGNAYALGQNLEKAIYYFKRMRRHHPQSSRSLQAIVAYCDKAGKSKLAEMTLRDEKKNNPSRVDTYFLLHDIYSKQELEDEAFAMLMEAATRNPQSREAYQKLGQYFLDRDDLTSLQETFRKCYQKTKNPNIYLQQAELLIKAKRFSLAIASLHAAMKKGVDQNKLMILLFAATYTTKQYGKCSFILKRVSQIGCNPRLVDQNSQRIQALMERRRQKSSKQRAS